MIFNVNFSSLISESEGFGINTDLFETNVLNLAVVIGVLVYYGRIALGNLLSERKANILKSLQEADNKFREAEESLAVAKKNFELAKAKSEQIRSQGVVLSTQTSKALLDSIDEDIKRLKAANLSSIRFEEEKSINEVCQKLSFSALSKAIESLTKRLNSNLQKKIVSQNIEKLSFKFLVRR